MSADGGFRFDNRVAIVTGAGRGLGRAHALLLAAHGAHVVVNDVGGSKEGEGSDAGPANQVVEEIVAAGGSGLADTHSVGTEAGCQALVADTVSKFGRVDIVINNAGISRWATFPEADADNLERTLDVHLRGTWHTTRAAWPHMVEQGYGRVITTASTGMLGLADNLAYATAKGALIGFTRSLAFSSEALGIRVNCIAPNAVTRPSESAAKPNIVTSSQMDSGRQQAMDPSHVSPMVALLAHESCPVNGEILVAGARRFGRAFLGFTPGWLESDEAGTSVGSLAEHWDEIVDESGYYVPTSTMDWGSRFMSHLNF